MSNDIPAFKNKLTLTAATEISSAEVVNVRYNALFTMNVL